MTEQRAVRGRAPEKPPPRRVRRAMKRLERGGRKGEKARTLFARYAAHVLESREIGRRLREAAHHEKFGTMPHRPTGQHQRKLEQRRESRKVRE